MIQLYQIEELVRGGGRSFGMGISVTSLNFKELSVFEFLTYFKSINFISKFALINFDSFIEKKMCEIHIIFFIYLFNLIIL